jgi:hypothetical protein
MEDWILDGWSGLQGTAAYPPDKIPWNDSPPGTSNLDDLPYELNGTHPGFFLVPRLRIHVPGVLPLDLVIDLPAQKLVFLVALASGHALNRVVLLPRVLGTKDYQTSTRNLKLAFGIGIKGEVAMQHTVGSHWHIPGL